MNQDPKLTNKGKDGKILPILHGELTLVPVSAKPKGKTKKHKELILSHSETGHNHVLEAPNFFKVIDGGSEKVLVVDEEATLRHDKSYDYHERIKVQPANYKMSEAIEYNPFTKVMQRVFD